MASIIYITYVDYNEENFSGVKKKISDQIKILKDNGNSVDLIVQYGKKAKLIRNNGSINFFSSFTNLVSLNNPLLLPKLFVINHPLLKHQRMKFRRVAWHTDIPILYRVGL